MITITLSEEYCRALAAALFDGTIGEDLHFGSAVAKLFEEAADRGRLEAGTDFRVFDHYDGWWSPEDYPESYNELLRLEKA